MVDVPHHNIFVFVICFLAFYSALLGFMPAEIFASTQQFRETNYPEYYSAQDLELIATTFNFTCDDDASGNYVDQWGIDESFGHHFEFAVTAWYEGGAYVWGIKNTHYSYFLIFAVDFHDMQFIDKDSGINWGETLSFDEIDDLTEVSTSTNITAARFYVKCDHVSMHMIVAYNYTLYQDSKTAYENNALAIEFGIDWDELGTGYAGWNLISAILFFQAPDIHPMLNIFIAIPLYASFIYLAYTLLMVAISVLPFT